MRMRWRPDAETLGGAPPCCPMRGRNPRPRGGHARPTANAKIALGRDPQKDIPETPEIAKGVATYVLALPLILQRQLGAGKAVGDRFVAVDLQEQRGNDRIQHVVWPRRALNRD